MVKVMALPVPLHDVRALGVVDVPDRVSCVGGDSFAVEPADILATDCTRGESAQRGEVEGGGGYAGLVAEDAPAGGIGQHRIPEAGDKVRCSGSFSAGSDEVW